MGSGPSDFISDTTATTTASDVSETLPAAGDDGVLPNKGDALGALPEEKQEKPPTLEAEKADKVGKDQAPVKLRKSKRINQGKHPSWWKDIC